MLHIEVVRGTGLKTGHSTPGITRKTAFEGENAIVSQTHLVPSAVSGWHHHGTRHLYGYLVSGRLRLEYGLGGKEAVEVTPGDFFHIPPRLVHRDLNPDRVHELTVVNILVGEGPAVVNVESP